MTATPAQIRYAETLQAELRERISWKIDRDQVADALRPRRTLYETAEEKAVRLAFDVEAAVDAWIARREELAAADLAALDKTAISQWIDAAKKA